MADQGIPATAESSAYFGEQWLADHSGEVPEDLLTYIEDLKMQIGNLQGESDELAHIIRRQDTEIEVLEARLKTLNPVAGVALKGERCT